MDPGEPFAAGQTARRDPWVDRREQLILDHLGFEMAMNVTDGSEIESSLERDCDVAIVGSGPAGATVARTLARDGVDVVVLEEGPWVPPDDLPENTFEALSLLWRDMAASLTESWPPLPLLQGVAVGGSSVINGSICWRLPRSVHEEWTERDPEFADAVPWEALENHFDTIEDDLHISPAAPEHAGRHNELMAEGAEALGVRHKPTDINVDGPGEHAMRGSPAGNKMSMDRTYLPEACDAGAEIVSCTQVRDIRTADGTVTGVRGWTRGGGEVRVRADRGVVMAASAIQTPALLIDNGIRHGPVGENLQGHPGSSVMGLFDEPVEMWTGPTQGHETLALKDEGIKLETLGYNPTLAVMRMKKIGRNLSREIARLDRWANGGTAVRAEATGTVSPKANGSTSVSFVPTEYDFRRLRKGVAFFGRLMLAAGAERVSLGVPGWEDIESVEEVETFESEGPVKPTQYEMILSHMFGTCRMGSDPADNVVDNRFEHHTVDRLFVADSSVFPSNIGVNPQISIIALARHCAKRMLEDVGG